jgi:2-polyprenyl-3-methyl-5-hydroxy-6-metoxy-1,4-benzoquinol methylase
MKMLVVIANHGTKNAEHLNRVLREYRSMSLKVDIVVLSNIPKDMGSDVEVIVGCPTKDPWSLPFGHKKIFADRLSHYDLFVYSEDDTLIAERNILAFLRVSEVLPTQEIPGFIRYEMDRSGNRSYSTIHSHFHWIPSSVRSIGSYTFARFTNDHSACYLLTREQLKTAIASGGFLVEPHDDRYDLLVSAATDPYTRCGFTKVLCVSHLEDFCLHHLPNQYIGKMGISDADLQLQLNALMSISENARPLDGLLNGETALRQGAWSKSYFEKPMTDVIKFVPPATKSVLSIGCGWGATESLLVERGLRVAGVPLDSVIGACAAARGVEVLPSNLGNALELLSGRSFDCMLFMDVLQHFPDPVDVLSRCKRLMAANGVLLISAPNFNHVGAWRAISRGEITWQQRWDFEKSRIHFTTGGLVKRWLRRSGLNPVKVEYHCNSRFRRISAWSSSLLDGLLGSEMIVVGKKEI